MEKLKNISLEYYLSGLLILSFLFFSFNYYNARKNESILIETEVKLKRLKENKRKITTKFLSQAQNLDELKEIFENKLKQAGFKSLISLTDKKEVLIAKVEKNLKIQTNIKKALPNCKITSFNKIAQISIKNHFYKKEKQYNLSGIALISKKDWVVIINDIEYSPNQNTLPNGEVIKKVEYDNITIESQGTEKVIKL